MVARASAPAKPELARQNNGLRVIRYPHKTAKGTVVSRNYRLGWCKEDEALRQFQVFQHHWSKMNGQGPAGVIAAMNKSKSTALVPVAPKDKKDKQRAYSRDFYHKVKANADSVTDADLAKLQDHIGVVAASLQAISTTVKMVQGMVTEIQRKRGT